MKKIVSVLAVSLICIQFFGASLTLSAAQPTLSSQPTSASQSLPAAQSHPSSQPTSTSQSLSAAQSHPSSQPTTASQSLSAAQSLPSSQSHPSNQPSPQLPEFLDVAYSSQDDGCHINTIEHFEAATQAGFNCLKTDMQMTSDGVVILCHDSGFTIDENGRIGKFNKKENTPIAQMSYKQIKKLEYYMGKADKGDYPKVCTLEKYIKYCKKAGVWLYITQRNDERMDATLQEVARLLKKHKMTDRCIINNYPALTSTCEKIHTYLPTVPVSFTLEPYQRLTRQMIDSIAAVGPAIICINRDKIPFLTKEIMDYAAQKGLRVTGWYPYSVEEYSEWISFGFTGAQITRKNVTSKAVALQSSVAEPAQQ